MIRMTRIVHGVESLKAGDLIRLDRELLRVIDRDGPRLHVVAVWPVSTRELPIVVNTIHLH